MCSDTKEIGNRLQLTYSLLYYFWNGEGSASIPISTSGVNDLRNLILRTLNDNQLLVLNAVSEKDKTLTSLLKQLSEDYGVPLSTLKLNARILRDLNLISYGSIHNRQTAQLERLGKFVMRILMEEPNMISITLPSIERVYGQ